ncbi:sphingomyelin phosphodiesterase-like isoform X2 [Tribolium madens]|uniref:sphingomyelin phosphodiesterase-like isoform X2 n=1 Tax=Tribolium madens TaxID=41895 RepID=UPI001CF724D5|nr:sphingomyelin phosphodiesterase-like isoform X2 [Tribolium madens]
METKLPVILFLLVVKHQTLKTEATPIAEVNVSNFKDDWNYKVEPNKMPVLSESSKNHNLPPPTKVEIPEKKFVKPAPLPERVAKKIGDAVRARVSCPICRLGVGLLQKEVKKNTSFEDIRSKFVGLCVAFKVESEDVCTGIFDVFGPDVLPALRVVQIGPDEICALVLGEVCGNVKIPLHEWQVEFPDVPKPNITKRDLPKAGLPTFKVLQISDTHFDPDYVVGSVANCEEPLCCRSTSTPPLVGQVVPAGKWGSYQKCDAPKILIDNMLKNIAEEHPDIDYVIWTGDLPPHDIWNQTKQSNLDILSETVEQMFEHFPNTPIFPALGNHESIPAGSFAPPWVQDPDRSIAWLYTKVADHWRKWLPASAGNTVLHGGFYSVLIRPGFRIISLNMNYCHTLSWWLVVNSTDPAKELKWLVHELQEAENKGEKVHLIGHIPPGSSDCMKVWSRNFNKIIERYENTIQAQFYGHTHADEFEVLYDVEESSRPISVAYLGPSVTTFEDHNPAYRIYYVDGDHENTTREILDHETWTIDLEEANKKNSDSKWYRLYSAKNAYKMDSLRPEAWAKLINDLVENPDLFELFYKHYYRDSPVRPTCDRKCKLQILCDLKSGRSHVKHQLCHDLELTFGS